jgi:hypothetical protein
MAKRPSDLVQIKIRMPRALHQKLARDAARTTAHTINAEIVKRLEASYQPDTLREDIAEIKQATIRSLEFMKAAELLKTKPDFTKLRKLVAEIDKPKKDKADD